MAALPSAAADGEGTPPGTPKSRGRGQFELTRRWDAIPPRRGMVLYTEYVAKGDAWMDRPDVYHLRYGARGDPGSVTYRCLRAGRLTAQLDIGSWVMVTRADYKGEAIKIAELRAAGDMWRHDIIFLDAFHGWGSSSICSSSVGSSGGDI